MEDDALLVVVVVVVVVLLMPVLLVLAERSTFEEDATADLCVLARKVAAVVGV